MKKAAILFAAIFAVSTHANAQFATIDVANIAKIAEQIKQAKKFADKRKEQLKDQIELIEGNDWAAAAGALENNRDFIPMDDWNEIEDIEVEEKREEYDLVSDDEEVQESYDRKIRYLEANESAYRAQEQHIANLEELQSRASEVETQQERQELANAIAIEKGAMQSDANRIKTINQNMNRQQELERQSRNAKLRERFEPQ